MDPRDVAAVFDLNCPAIEDGMAEGVIILEEDVAIDRVVGDDADTLNVAQGARNNTTSAGTTAGTGETLSTEESASDDEVQSTPTSQDAPPKPYPSMLFDSWQEAKLHYNKYAKHVGFSIKSSTSRRSVVDNETAKYLFVCNKSGKNEDVNQQDAPPVKQRNRSITKKKDCRARLRVKRVGVKWQVTMFVEEHNHPLVKKFSLKRYLRSHRKIPKEEKEFIKLLHQVNLSSGRIMQIMAELYGELGFVPYIAKDVSNLTAGFDAANTESDMHRLVDYFEKIKEEDPDFYYKLHVDHANRVDHLFWVDGAARSTYKLYHDCVSFDTTYMTNMYNMPCAPFIGINRYGQSIQLGCGFVGNEKIPNFVWLFSAFLEAMGGVQPTNLITDQDGAMKSVVLVVFPNTIHRNCRWHVIKKVQEKLGNYMSKRDELRKEFNNTIDYSMTVDEFERNWADMLARHGVQDNTHLQDLYDI